LLTLLISIPSAGLCRFGVNFKYATFLPPE
jgi:hypothetical protein